MSTDTNYGYVSPLLYFQSSPCFRTIERLFRWGKKNILWKLDFSYLLAPRSSLAVRQWTHARTSMGSDIGVLLLLLLLFLLLLLLLSFLLWLLIVASPTEWTRALRESTPWTWRVDAGWRWMGRRRCVDARLNFYLFIFVWCSAKAAMQEDNLNKLRKSFKLIK